MLGEEATSSGTSLEAVEAVPEFTQTQWNIGYLLGFFHQQDSTMGEGYHN